MSNSENINNILSRVLAKKNLGKQYLAAHVCAVAKEVSAGEFEPVSFRAGVLKISVSSPARAHLLRSREEDLILKINNVLKREMIKKIRFEIKN